MELTTLDLRYGFDERDALRQIEDQISEITGPLERSTDDLRMLRTSIEQQWRAAHERVPGNGLVFLAWADSLLSLETEAALQTAASMYETAARGFAIESMDFLEQTSMRHRLQHAIRRLSHHGLEERALALRAVALFAHVDLPVKTRPTLHRRVLLQRPAAEGHERLTIVHEEGHRVWIRRFLAVQAHGGRVDPSPIGEPIVRSFSSEQEARDFFDAELLAAESAGFVAT